MSEVLALVAFVIAGLPIALLMLRGAPALFAGAVVSGVLATFAGMAHVLLDLPITIAWLGLLVVGYAVVAAIPRLRRAAWANLRAGVTRLDVVQLAIALVVVIVAVALVPAPLGWDARSIWLFHATWLDSPAAVFVDGQNLPATSFSHPNYPFLGPAAMAIVWGLAGASGNFVLAVQVSALLTFLVIALGASLVVRSFGRDVNLLVVAAAFFAYLTLGFAISSGTATLGYMDPLQAASVAALVAALTTSFARRPSLPAILLVTFIALFATNIKQEGLFFVLAALGVFVVVSARRQSVRKYVPIAAVLVFYAVWKVFLRWADSPDVSDASGVAERLPELLNPSSTAWSIMWRVATNEFLGQPSTVVLIAVVLLIAAAVARRSAIASLRVALVGLAPIAVATIVTATYALGETRDRIDWWLATSYVRIISTTEMLAWFGVLFAVLLLCPWRRGGRQQTT